MTVSGSGDTVVLTGTVKDATEVKRIEGLAHGAGKESGESVADAARARAAADPAAGEVRRHRPRGAAADRLQSVQPNMGPYSARLRRSNTLLAALQPVAVSERAVLEFDGQFFGLKPRIELDYFLILLDGAIVLPGIVISKSDEGIDDQRKRV